MARRHRKRPGTGGRQLSRSLPAGQLALAPRRQVRVGPLLRPRGGPGAPPGGRLAEPGGRARRGPSGPRWARLPARVGGQPPSRPRKPVASPSTGQNQVSKRRLRSGWIALLEAVSACVEADSPMGPLGLRYREEDGFWGVGINPTPVELVGGVHDETLVARGFPSTWNNSARPSTPSSPLAGLPSGCTIPMAPTSTSRASTRGARSSRRCWPRPPRTRSWG